MNTQEKIDYIVNWLKERLVISDMKGFVVGISGGIDSAVVSTLCAETGMPTLLVHIPIKNYHEQSSYSIEYTVPEKISDSTLRAKSHLEKLSKKYDNVESQIIDLTGIYNMFSTTFRYNNTSDMALVNSKARLRMTSLYQLSAARGYLVVGTGNKVEDFGIGFYSKYGDGGVDLSPIADLYKSEVYELGRALEVNNDILTAVPADDLWYDNRSDETQIGATYDELENIMKKMNLSDEQTYYRLTDREKKVLKIYINHRNKNMHKMIPIPVCKF
jgi:NAD+ synthase